MFSFRTVNCLRSLILIVSSRNIEKAGNSQKRYDL